jgi:type IV pilus assembly protein PilM
MFGRARRVVGLDIGSSALKAVELKRTRGGYELLSLGVEPLAPETVNEGGIHDAEAMSGAIERLFEEQKIDVRDVATSIAGHAVIVKQLAAPAIEASELHDWVQSVAPQHVPFEPSDVDLSYQLLDGAAAQNGGQLLLVAAKKDKVHSHSEAIRKAGRNPIVMDIDAFALANCYEANYDPGPEDIVALIDLGASLTNITVVRGLLPLFTRDVSVGGQQYTDALQREFNLDYEEAEKLKRGESGAAPPDQVELVLQSFLDMIVAEIGRTFDFFRSSGGDRIDRILLSGGSCRLPRLPELLLREFSVAVEEIDPLRHVAIPADRFDEARVRELAPQLAVSVGLALRSFDPT